VEKVLTCIGFRDFWFHIVTDYSGDLKGVERAQIVKLKLRNAITFGDEHTKRCFDVEEAAFIQMNRFRDVHYNYWRRFFVPNLEGRPANPRC